MSAPPLAPSVRTCESKHRHPDELTARAAAQRHLQSERCDVAVLWIYQCPECRGWHLTKRRGDKSKHWKVTADEVVHG